MAVTTSRDAYFEAGLDILSTSGYGSLKLAALCTRLGVTTGSFYHYFKNWADYTAKLLEYWLDSRTRVDVAHLRSEPDPEKRIDDLLSYGLRLPHQAEHSFRIWGATDPRVSAVVESVDRERYSVVHEAVSDLVGPTNAHRYASWALYLLTGYDFVNDTADTETLEWVAQHLVDAIKADAARQSLGTRPHAEDEVPEKRRTT